MKRIILTALTGLLCSVSNTQPLKLQWAKQIGDTNANHPENTSQAQSVATDKNANVYTTGSFAGTVDFDPGPGVFNLSSNGLSDTYITKFDEKGNFIWAKCFGGFGNNTTGVHNSITVDNNANVYITGTFTSTVDFDPGNGTFNLSQKSPFSDIFIVKLNSNGNFVWAKNFGGADQEWLHKITIAVDAQQNVYTAGHLNGTADFNPGNNVFNLTSAGEEDIFVSKLDVNGNFVWAKRMGGTGSEAAIAISIDKEGNVYTTGTFWEMADFNPADGFLNLFMLTPLGIADTFISKLDKNGNFVWAKQLGGNNNGKTHSTALTTDNDNNVLVTGYFWNTVDFDPGDDVFFMNSSSPQMAETYVCKITTEGNFVWAGKLDGDLRTTSIITDAIGDVYTTGFFWKTCDFDPTRRKFEMTSSGEADIFISKIGSSGNFIFAKQIGGPASDAGNYITLNTQGNIHLAGLFENTVDFNMEEEVFNLSNIKQTSFIAKYDQPLPEINIKQGNKNIPHNGIQNFGTVQVFTNKDIVFTIQNLGAKKLIFNTINVTGDFTTTGPLPFNIIEPGLSTNITIRMKASNTIGLKMGKLIITSNDLDETMYTVNLTGIVDNKLENVVTITPENNPVINDNHLLINAYPNPTHNIWNVNTNITTPYSYTLLNQYGSILLNGTSATSILKIPAEQLPAGVYLLHINDNKSKDKKIIKLLKE